jgi:pimeloyl-ACP methyl ester carboxylesterase
VNSARPGRLGACVSALLLGLLACLPAARAADSALAECRMAGLRHSVLCGTLARPLDPAQPGGKQIDIHYVVVPAMARRKLPDPVFLLAGGPGQSAIDLAPALIGQFGRLNNRRDIVFVDQRGTGRSAPLLCDDPRREPLAEQFDSERQVARLLACKVRLQALPHGDLRFYTTTLAMQDLDAVRLRLDAERINLVGASYGTRAALEYQRLFPRALRRSVIDGVAPADMALPASFSTDGQAVLEALFDACEAEAACKKAFPALRADWQALLASLPTPVSVRHPLTGQPERLTLTREIVLAAVRAPLYVPALAAGLPAAIAEAARGRYEALVGLGAALGTRSGGKFAMGMHFSVVCAEDAPLVARSLDTPGADFGRDNAQLYARVCAAWPRGAVPAEFYKTSASATPVLLLSGGLDPATPPRHAARVAQALGPAARHVVVPGAGHGVMGLPCLRDVIFHFIDAVDDGASAGVAADCGAGVPRPPMFQPIAPATPGQTP